MSDRQYFHVMTRPHAPRRAWHGVDVRQSAGGYLTALCGFVCVKPPEYADRLPPTAHLCQNCGRVIAAQTDVEDTSYGVTVIS